MLAQFHYLRKSFLYDESDFAQDIIFGTAANKRKHDAPAFEKEYSRRAIVFAAGLVLPRQPHARIYHLIAWVAVHRSPV